MDSTALYLNRFESARCLVGNLNYYSSNEATASYIELAAVAARSTLSIEILNPFLKKKV